MCKIIKEVEPVWGMKFVIRSKLVYRQNRNKIISQHLVSFLDIG